MNDIIEEIKNTNRPVIYTCSSQYNLLLALILISLTKRKKQSYIVMFSPESSVVHYFYKISDKIDRIGIKNAVIDKKTRLQRAIGLSDIKNNMVKKRVYKELRTADKKYCLVNFSWNNQIVRYPASLYFKDCETSFFVEEGAAQFVTPNENPLYVILKRIYGNQYGFWKDSRVKAIYVQKQHCFPEYMRNKIRGFSWENIVQMLDQSQKVEIAKTLADEKDIDQLLTTQEKGCRIIVFTQPLSEDGFISESKKKSIYNEIVDHYSKNGRVAVKIHPRDTTVYGFKDVEIISGKFPSEVFGLLNISFDLAVGICTSAIETVDAKKRVNINQDYLRDYRIIFKD